MKHVRLEDVVGRPVRDADGRDIGRLHDVRAELLGSDLVVVDYLVGPTAFLERFSIAGMAYSALGIFGLARTAGYVVAARDMDLSTPGEPRCTRRSAELERTHR